MIKLIKYDFLYSILKNIHFIAKHYAKKINANKMLQMVDHSLPTFSIFLILSIKISFVISTKSDDSYYYFCQSYFLRRRLKLSWRRYPNLFVRYIFCRYETFSSSEFSLLIFISNAIFSIYSLKFHIVCTYVRFGSITNTEKIGLVQ